MFDICLRDMELFPCKSKPDIFIKYNRDIYEYIYVYVDDLSIASRYPKIPIVKVQAKGKRTNLIPPWVLFLL